MAVKERALDWFCSQCTNCRNYAGIEKEKPCTLKIPCMSKEEFKIVREELEREDEQA